MRALASLAGAAALLFLFSTSTAARAADDGAPTTTAPTTSAPTTSAPTTTAPTTTPSTTAPTTTAPPTTAPTTMAATRVTNPETRWYGWQTLAVDMGSLGLGLALGSAGQGGLGAYAAIAGYMLGAPIVHVAHGRSDAALGDVALRLGAPLLGAAIGYGVGAASSQGCAPGEWFCGRDVSGLVGAALGGLGGAATAVILDATVLGRERVRRDDDEAVRAPQGVRWTPQVAVSPRGEPSVGVGGTF